MEFIGFPKIARLNRECVITEKLDGTNAQVYIRILGDTETMPTDTPIVAVRGNLLIYAGSRTRWLTPTADNYGFAKWVTVNADELATLGEGRHFGEWWGVGIQRGYGAREKKFSLFNTERWTGVTPACCGVVPVLYSGSFSTEAVMTTIATLRNTGSIAAPGFMHPEGVVCYHKASKTLYKVTLEKDMEWKGKSG